MTGFEHIQACMRQLFAQQRCVASEPVRVVSTDDDRNGYLDRPEARREYRQVFRVCANERG